MSQSHTDDSHEEIRELLGVYAVDAVDPETAALVERHLGECIKCSLEVDQHHQVVGLLANSRIDPPARVWDGIARRIEAAEPPPWREVAERLSPAATPDHAEPAGDAAVEPAAARAARRWSRNAVVAVAAVAVVAALLLGIQVQRLDHRVSALQSPTLTQAEQAAVRAPGTKEVTLTPAPHAGGPAPADDVTVVLTRSGTGFVEAQNLSPLPDSKTYQLWGVIGGRAISLGLLGSRPAVTPFTVSGGATVAAFAITAEHAGGVVVSTHQPVVEGTLAA